MAESDRVIIPMVFGQGLDRETGIMATQTASMEYLSNVFLYTEKAVVRKGFQRRVHLIDDMGNPMTHALEVESVLADESALAVGYNDVNGELHFFEVDEAATVAKHLGEWTDGSIFPQGAGDPPPVVHLAAFSKKCFAAHDKSQVAFRAQTQYVDFAPTTPTVNALTSDLKNNETAPEPIRFRGVVRHLQFMFGWGFGTEIAGTPTGEDRPEMVRVSKAGQPELYNHNHYFFPGERDDPTLRCLVAGGTLLALKSTEAHEIFGASRGSFGTRQIDPQYGIIGSRLGVTVSGLAFVWTTSEGPRVFDGSGPSQSMELPLDLKGSEPLDLPLSETDVDNAFAVYQPIERILWFVWGKRAYTLSLRSPGDWKWTYQSLGFAPNSGFNLPARGSGLKAAPTGTPTLTPPSVSNIMDTTADVLIQNSGQDGDEFTEVWTRFQGGPWVLNTSIPTGGGATDTAGMTGLRPGWLHDVAVRYARGSGYSPGYESADPTQWPAGARDTFTTTLTEAPIINSATWSRTSASAEQINLAIAAFAAEYVGLDVEIFRDSVSIFTEVNPTITPFSFIDTGIVGETLEGYKVRYVTTYATGPDSSDTFRWAGPDPGPTQTALVGDDDEYHTIFDLGVPTLQTQIRDNWNNVLFEVESYPFRVVRTVAAGIQDQFIRGVDLIGADGKMLTVGVRHVQTTFGVEDYSTDSTTGSPVTIGGL